MRPRLYATCGLSFAGKTTFARRLGSELGCAVVGYDELFATLPRPEGLSRLAEWQYVVDAVHERARAELAAGRSVIVDNLNEDSIDRSALRWIADACSADLVVLYVDTPLDVIEMRRKKNERTPTRGTTSEEQFEFVRSRFETPDECETVIRLLPDDDIARRVQELST